MVKVEEEEVESEPVVGDYAGLGRRFFAFIIDLILLFILGAIAAAFFGLIRGVQNLYFLVVQHAPISSLTPEGTSLSAYITIIAAYGVLFVIIPWFYFAGFECSRGMATPGKTVMNIVVTDRTGSRVTFSRATIRHFVKYISAAIVLIGFIMIGLTKKRQGLHDRAADCLVILTPE